MVCGHDVDIKINLHTDTKEVPSPTKDEQKKKLSVDRQFCEKFVNKKKGFAKLKIEKKTRRKKKKVERRRKKSLEISHSVIQRKGAYIKIKTTLKNLTFSKS